MAVPDSGIWGHRLDTNMGPTAIFPPVVFLPTSQLWRITSPSENVKLQTPVCIRVLLPELNVQSHMFTMNLQLCTHNFTV